MYTVEALRQLHEEGHLILARLISHGRSFTEKDLVHQFEGFGYPSLHLQLHHVVGAERYWFGVLEGRIDAEDDADQFTNVGLLESFRSDVAQKSQNFLRNASQDYLNQSCTVTTWGGRSQEVVPARVILRVIMHNFHHQGQMAALCRLLGQPVEGLEFPTG